MGKRDSKSRAYFSNKERFADLVNGVCFKGEQVLKPEELSVWDSRSGQKTRDMVYLASFGVGFAVIGEESQETVDYSLPFRVMESDIGDYRRQVIDVKRRIRRLIKEKDESVAGLKTGERLYAFSANDRLYPVITIVLSNADNWEGPRDLLDMLDMENIPEELYPMINGYKLNILELSKLTKDYTARFQTDLRQVLDVIRCYRNKDELEALLKNNPEYRNVDEEAYELINEYVNLKKHGLYSANEKKGGKINLTDGIEGIKQKYKEIGEKSGKEIGKEELVIEIICKKLL